MQKCVNYGSEPTLDPPLHPLKSIDNPIWTHSFGGFGFSAGKPLGGRRLASTGCRSVAFGGWSLGPVAAAQAHFYAIRSLRDDNTFLDYTMSTFIISFSWRFPRETAFLDDFPLDPRYCLPTLENANFSLSSHRL